jgi:probable HAF family extracellular repeat protein
MTSTRSFVLKGTTYTLLDYPPTTDDPENPTGWLRAHDINDHGMIVGGCTDVNGSHGCYSSGGAWVLLDYPGAASTEAFGVNNRGIIVGQYTGADGSTHGFSYDGTTWNTLDHPGATSTIAYDINDRGTIVGTFEDTNGGTHGFLANAVSDLASLAIDIRPWSAENVIHILDRGLLPVAVLSGSAFDAVSTMDLGAITFGRTGDEDSMAFCSPWDWDVNADGYQDLVCLFWVRKAGFECGDTGGILKGMTLDGATLEGRDAVKVIPSR